jgi:DNA polymerase
MHLELTHDPAECVFFDFETQSQADLKKVGGRKYAADASTRVLTADFLIDGTHHAWVPATLWPDRPPPIDATFVTPRGMDTPIVVHHTPGLPEPVVQAVCHQRIFVGHNLAEFDYWVWSHKLTPLPSRWFDTLFTARAAGFPGKLDELGKRLTGRGKDEGQKILSRITREPHKPPKPGYVAAILRYNLWDVHLTKLVYDLTADHGEADVITLHQAINDRGVGFDVTFGKAIHALSVQAIEKAATEITRLTNGALHAGNLRSVPQVQAWLKTQGVMLPDLRQDTIDRFLEQPDDFGADVEGVPVPSVSPVVFPVLRLRQAALRITGAKLERALSIVDADGRIRGLLSYHNAHTGRFSSSKMQIHNLPRGLSGLDVEALASLHDQGQLTYEAVEQAVAPIPNATVDDALSSLVRLTLVPALGKVFLIADFNAIELRGTAWVAGERNLLDQFAAGQDVYCHMASRIFGRPVVKGDKTERNVGKVTCLGAGYGMSSHKFALYCAAQRIDLAAAGTTADACIESFRAAYPAVAGQPAGVLNGRIVRKGGIWNQYNSAALRAVLERATVRAGRCTFTRNGADLVIALPSGRDLIYRHCRVEDRIPGYVYLLGLPEKLKPTLVYDGPRGEAALFGGKITENLVQAICRDLLCWAMLRCEQAGLPVTAHVHDELICEVPTVAAEAGLRQMVALMSAPPPWAADFPIVVEGFASPRYTKAAFKGWVKNEAKNSIALR